MERKRPVSTSRFKHKTFRLVIAGGGTGGHVLPAVSVIEELRRREIPVELLWIGSHSGVEREVAAGVDVRFAAIQTGKLRRYASVKTVTDMFRIPVGVAQARRLLRRFRPDVLYSTGGNVSVPSALAAFRMIPVLTHEQTAQIGVANRIVARVADVFAVTYEQTADLASRHNKHVVVTGNPVRASLRRGDATRGRATWGLTDQLPIVYITGGARGASPLNQRVAALLPDLLQHAQVIHQAGPATANNDAADLARMRAAWPEELQRRYRVVDFINDGIGDVFAAADLVIGRAGAGTVCELAFLGKPSILIPLPGTWGDEQRKNARVLANVDAAVVLEQDDATPETLRETILGVIREPERLMAMGEAARGAGREDAAARLTDELLALGGFEGARLEPERMPDGFSGGPGRDEFHPIVSSS